jgi:phosphate starvation-inducible PhoH-like protein
LSLPSPEAAVALAGPSEANLRRLEALTGTSLVLYGLDLRIQGRDSQVNRAHAVLLSLKPLWESGEPIAAVDLQTALTALDTGKQEEHGELARQVLTTTRQGRDRKSVV